MKTRFLEIAASPSKTKAQEHCVRLIREKFPGDRGLEGCSERLWVANDLLLSDDALSDISPLADLPNLFRLRLSCSSTSPVDLRPVSTLTNLRALEIAGAPLTDLSPLNDLHHLEGLSLNENELEDFSSLKQLDKLAALHIYNNQPKDLSSMGPFPNLLELKIYQGKLKSFNALPAAPSLMQLEVTANRIRDFNGSDKYPKLREISLRQNRISNFDGLSEELKDLTLLDVGNNYIVDDAPLAKLKSLKTVRLDDNPITVDQRANHARG